MRETVKVNMKYQVTIPENVRKMIPLQAGDRVEVLARRNEIVIRPLVEVPRDQAWFWDKEWQEMERTATLDLKNGKTKSFEDVEEAIEWLNS